MPTDTAGPALGAPTGPSLGSAPSLNAMQQASARETWISLGLDVARFDAAALGQTTTPAPSPDNPGEGNPGSPEIGHRLSDQQVTQAIAALQAAGMSDEKIMEAARLDGFTATEVTEEQLAVLRHDDNWGLSKPASPAEMTITYREHGVDPATVTPAYDMELRQFAASTRLEAAPSVMGELISIVAKVDRLPEFEAELWRRSEKVDAIRALGGPEEYAAAVERVDGFLRALPDSPTKRSLINGPASKSAYFLKTFNAHVKRIDAWHASRPGRKP